MTVLITGAAGFIGYHLCRRLLEDSLPVVGFDNLNSYYDPKLKNARLSQLNQIASSTGTSFNFVKGDLINTKEIKNTFPQIKTFFQLIKLQS